MKKLPSGKIYKSLDNYWDDDKKMNVHHKMDIREKINDLVEQLMVLYGPDGHTDGSWSITDLIYFLLSCNAEQREQFLKLTDFNEIEKLIFKRQ